MRDILLYAYRPEQIMRSSGNGHQNGNGPVRQETRVVKVIAEKVLSDTQDLQGEERINSGLRCVTSNVWVKCPRVMPSEEIVPGGVIYTRGLSDQRELHFQIQAWSNGNGEPFRTVASDPRPSVERGGLRFTVIRAGRRNGKNGSH